MRVRRMPRRSDWLRSLRRCVRRIIRRSAFNPARHYTVRVSAMLEADSPPLLRRPSAVLSEWVQSVQARCAYRRVLIVSVVLAVAYLLTCGALALQLFGARTADGSAPVTIRCHETFVRDTGSTCGINGQNCRPFVSDWVTYRCPRDCQSAPDVYGSGPYRADSPICRAAIHAGLIDSSGGCFQAKLNGNADFLPASSRHGIDSVEFAAPFPITFTVKSAPGCRLCSDLTPILLPLMLLTIVSSILVGISDLVLWWVIILNSLVYVNVSVFSLLDPVVFAENTLNNAFGVLFGCWILWRAGGRTHFASVRHCPLEMFLCCILPYLVVIHLDYIYLISNDLNIMLSGHFFAKTPPLVSIVFVVFLFVLFIGVAAVHMRVIMQTYSEFVTLVKNYAQWTSTFVAFIIPVAIASQGKLLPHLHHWMVPLLFWPILAYQKTPTRLTKVSQAVLLGLYVNGAGLWGLAGPYDLTSSFVVDTWNPYLRVASNAFDPQTNTSVVSVAWSPNVTSHDSGVYSLQFSNVELYRGPSLNYTLPRIKTDSMYQYPVCLARVLSKQAVCNRHNLLYFNSTTGLAALLQMPHE
ncbi:LCCL domain-containing protein [Plasmodiophora brassicae]|nr:hypothetical protein PBRA_000687 [Plasmodiophora brassicae]